MIIFAVNILLFLIVLGVWLWMDTRKKSKQKDVVVDAEGSCKSYYRFFFWLFLRFLIYVLVTVLLFTIMLSFYEDDYPEDSLSWLMIFAILGWFISIPIVLVYICSLVQSVWYRNYVNNIFLGLHCFNILQVLCIAVFAIIPQKECTPERMEADFRANHQKIEMLIRITRS